jgi:hypothetical protein
MKVKNALELLNELPLEAVICIQWFDQEDMTKDGEDLTTEVWELANAVFDRYQNNIEMYYALEEAIDEAKQRLTEEQK